MARAYAAPELSGGDGRPGFRSDQFSVMAIAYEMLTGRLPYDGLGGKAWEWTGENAAEIPFTPPSPRLKADGSLPKRLARLLDELFTQSLAIDPSRRYAGGRAWVDALGDVAKALEGKPELGRRNRWLLEQLGRIGDRLRGRP